MQKKEKQKLLFEWLLKVAGFFCGIIALFFMEGQLLFFGWEKDITLGLFIMKLTVLLFGIILFELSLKSKYSLNKATSRAKVCYLLFLSCFVWLILLPSGGMLRYEWDIRTKARCEGNLRHLAEGLQMYALDNNGSFPSTVDQFAHLYPKYVSNPRYFWCPGDFNNEYPAPDNIISTEPDAPNSAQISYIYTPGLSQESDPGMIILKDNIPSNHLGVGVNVLHVNGFVAFKSAPGKSWKQEIRQRTISYYLRYHTGKIIIFILTIAATIHWIVLRLARKKTNVSS